MAITARQRCHYSTMTAQQSARIQAIRALVNLSRFPDESDGAIRALRMLDASPVEMESGTTALPASSEWTVATSFCQAWSIDPSPA
jgi:hypothetical protein